VAIATSEQTNKQTKKKNMKNTANCQIEVNSYYLDLLDAEREKKAEISRRLKITI